jgi:mannose-6-phosphate isomerase-like protein (cupin superfamily)
MRKLVFRAFAIVIGLVPVVMVAQSPRTKPTTATYITKEEVDIVNHQGQGTDRNIKVVDIGHENFTVGIIHRGKTVNGVMVPTGAAANAAPGAGRSASAPPPTPCGRQMATAPAGGSAGGITHDSQTEGYYIVSGGGTMITDGYIVNGRHNLSPDLNGPTCGGMAYDVVKKVVKPGDIVIVPAGVVHGWIDIPEHVDYLSFRPSPGILTAGWVHPVLKK